MTNRPSLPKRVAGNPFRLWLISQLGLTLLVFGGCGAPFTVDRPAPFARVAANAKRIFQVPSVPAESQSGSSRQPSDAKGDQVSTTIGLRNTPAIASPEQMKRSPLQNSDLQNSMVYDATIPEPNQPWTNYFQDEVVQAQYQEPLGRTYSNPSPHQGYQQQQNPTRYRQLYGSQSYDQYSQTFQQMMRQKQAMQQRPGQLPDGYQPNAVTSHFASQPVLQGPSATQSPPNQNYLNQQPRNMVQTSSEPTVNPNEAPAPSIPIHQATDPNSGFGTRHLAYGMQLGGTMLRQPDQTASEIALKLLDENYQLHEKLKSEILKSDNLAEEIKTQASALVKRNEELDTAHQLAAIMREKIAKLNVKNQDLELEKVVIQQDADKALQEIESNLNSMLLNSLSISKQQP